MASDDKTRTDYWLAASGWHEGATLAELRPVSMPSMPWLLNPSFRHTNLDDDQSRLTQIWRGQAGMEYAERQAAIQVAVVKQLLAKGAERYDIETALAYHAFPQPRHNKVILFATYYFVLPANFCEGTRSPAERIVGGMTNCASSFVGPGSDAFGGEIHGYKDVDPRAMARFVTSAATQIPDAVIRRWEHRYGHVFRQTVTTAVNAYHLPSAESARVVPNGQNVNPGERVPPPERQTAVPAREPVQPAPPRPIAAEQGRPRPPDVPAGAIPPVQPQQRQTPLPARELVRLAPRQHVVIDPRPPQPPQRAIDPIRGAPREQRQRRESSPRPEPARLGPYRRIAVEEEAPQPLRRPIGGVGYARRPLF